MSLYNSSMSLRNSSIRTNTKYNLAFSSLYQSDRNISTAICLAQDTQSKVISMNNVKSGTATVEKQADRKRQTINKDMNFIRDKGMRKQNEICAGYNSIMEYIVQQYS